MKSTKTALTYHVVLIGIDSYPPGYNSLHGCVNDIDTLERLLLEPPGIGIPPEQFQVTRLAAPHAGTASTSHFVEQTEWPTKEKIVATLKGLAGADVKQSDRVLIYYSGHGYEDRWTGSSVWHEALVVNDGQMVDYLFDVEMNALINAIAARTNDLTVILDCCHSAGATRSLEGIQSAGQLRFLQHKVTQVAAPDLTKLGLSPTAGAERAITTGMLRSSSPQYLAVVACQADERAGEGADPAYQPSLGVFTHSLWSVLNDKSAEQRAQLRWADIWPTLLAKTEKRNLQLRQRIQHPWIIGRSERRVFGGPWEKMDTGYQVTKRADGDYRISAGTLMGVTEGAEIAIYGPMPRFFPPLGSPADQPVGRLTVTKAERAEAVAVSVEATFVLPQSARGRLVKPGQSERLRVSLKPEGTAIPALLAESPLLEIVPATAVDADVEVIAQAHEGWTIGNDTEKVLAFVPDDKVFALCAGLESYYRYNAVLRLARNCNEPELNQKLSIVLLDCNDSAALTALSERELADPQLPEAPRDQDGIYAVPTGFKSCVRVTNTSAYDLHVTLVACTSGGLVQLLDYENLRGVNYGEEPQQETSQVMWLDHQPGKPFEAWPDELDIHIAGIELPTIATDRFIAIGTTKDGVDLSNLKVEKTVQQVIDENLSRRGPKEQRPRTMSSAPVELWTATVAPLRIARQ